ncbi:MAG: hypothetical protein ACXQTS_02250, partial [Candidatus Methanospirareceae archaeon]
MKSLAGKGILIIDATHGGDILAEELGEGSEVTLIDCYRTLRDSERKRLQRGGIEVRYEIDMEEAGEKDLIISPVHCPFFNPLSSSDTKIISHHEAVGILLKERKEDWGDTEFIEITGLRGKTSTAFFLYEILSEAGGKILFSGSLGVFYRKKETERKIDIKGDITPAFSISVLREAEKRGLEVDFAIFEHSLGFTGAADINVLTNIEREYDYRIAGGKESAIRAKIYTTKFLEDGKRRKKLVLSQSAYDEFFRPKDATLDFLTYDSIEAEIGEEFSDALLFSPRSNILASAMAARCADIDIETIKAALRKSKGVPGRMSSLFMNNWIIVDNSNPSVDITALKASLERIKRWKENNNWKGHLIVIFGG